MSHAAGAAPRAVAGRPACAPLPLGRGPSGISLNERLVRERDRERARELLRYLIFGVVILAPLLLHVWQQVVFVETAYRVTDLQKERARAESLLRKVRTERQSLESLERVERIARERLGLVRPAVTSVTLVGPAEEEPPPPARPADTVPEGRP